MDRRKFVALAGAGSAVSLPGTAALAGIPTRGSNASSFEDVAQWAGRIRLQMQDAGQRFRVRCEAAPRLRELRGEESEDPRTASISRCFRGMYGYGILRTVPLEQQAHPAMQDLLEEVCHDVGDGISEVVDLFEGLSPDARSALDELANDLESTTGMVDLLEAEMGIVDLPTEARDRAAGVFQQLRWNIKYKRFSGEVERLSQKVRRLQRKAERIIRSGDISAIGAPDNAAKAQLMVGAQQWSMDSGAGGDQAINMNKTLGKKERQPVAAVSTVVLGALVMGVGVVFGLLAVGFGIAALWCPCVGIPLILAGIAIFSTGIAYGPLLIRRGLRMGEERRPREPIKYRSQKQLVVPPTEDWVDTGIDLTPDNRYYLTATGSVKLSLGWRTSPLGSSRKQASKGALMVKGPEGGLVASVNGRKMVLSDRIPLPKELEGRLLLGVNISDSHRSRRHRKGKRDWLPGKFSVRVFTL